MIFSRNGFTTESMNGKPSETCGHDGKSQDLMYDLTSDELFTNLGTIAGFHNLQIEHEALVEALVSRDAEAPQPATPLGSEPGHPEAQGTAATSTSQSTSSEPQETNSIYTTSTRLTFLNDQKSDLLTARTHWDAVVESRMDDLERMRQEGVSASTARLLEAAGVLAFVGLGGVFAFLLRPLFGGPPNNAPMSGSSPGGQSAVTDIYGLLPNYMGTLRDKLGQLGIPYFEVLWLVSGLLFFAVSYVLYLYSRDPDKHGLLDAAYAIPEYKVLVGAQPKRGPSRSGDKSNRRGIRNQANKDQDVRRVMFACAVLTGVLGVAIVLFETQASLSILASIVGYALAATILGLSPLLVALFAAEAHPVASETGPATLVGSRGNILFRRAILVALVSGLLGVLLIALMLQVQDSRSPVFAPATVLLIVLLACGTPLYGIGHAYTERFRAFWSAVRVKARLDRQWDKLMLARASVESELLAASASIAAAKPAPSHFTEGGTVASAEGLDPQSVTPTVPVPEVIPSLEVRRAQQLYKLGHAVGEALRRLREGEGAQSTEGLQESTAPRSVK